MSDNQEHPHHWTFLTNHAHVLVCLSRKPDMKMREIASIVGVTERAVQKIIADLTHEGYLEIDRAGRCNKYRLHTGRHLRHPIEAGHTIAELLCVVQKTNDDAAVSDSVAPPGISG